MFRLQPIFDVRGSLNFGYEVLSFFSNKFNYEEYFSTQDNHSLFSIFKFQVDFFKGKSKEDFYFININLENLLSVNIINWIVENCPENMIIEIQDPGMLSDHNLDDIYIFQSNIIKLRYNNIKIWLDDADESILDLYRWIGVDGVKIDKHVFWKHSNDVDYLSHLVRESRMIASFVLFEGIEYGYQKDISIEAGADYCQGFYWPEKRVFKTSSLCN